MFTFSTLVLLCVVGFWLYAMRRPAEPANDPDVQRVHNRWIIGGGLLLPSFSILLLLTFGIPIGHRMLPLPPADGEVVEVHVIGHQWWWEIEYPDAQPSRSVTTANEIHIAVGRTAKLVLDSRDVIHSFWAPGLGGKRDLTPGHTTHLAFQADSAGEYWGQCAEFCGASHANMRLRVFVETDSAFQAWVDRQRSPAAAPAPAKAPCCG